ncbi:protein son [Plakobranchus ocellatus]|uniref:Protein son n=1 Tax=Plakobranchus ocellatus TaxID=259542 RepID=A0AAV4B1B6_9GAST|nr:protein son [Plakobranchus ocellatus]
MAGSDISSIPLPCHKDLSKPSKKSVKEVLREALKDSEKSLSDASKLVSLNEKSNSPGSSKIEITLSAEGKSSQSIVDELFKDFIAQKFNRNCSNNDLPQSEKKTGSPTGYSVDKISKILDMEIHSIKKNSNSNELYNNRTPSPVVRSDILVRVPSEKHHHKGKSRKRRRSDSKTELLLDKQVKDDTSASSVPVTVKVCSKTTKAEEKSDDLSSEASSKEDPKEEINRYPHSNIVLPTTVSEILRMPLPQAVDSNSKTNILTLSPSVSNSHSVVNSSQAEPGNEDMEDLSNVSKTSSGLMLPAPLAKKQAIPKQLGLKLTSTSVSLIKSMERIDKDGHVWEEGEINSSQSENGLPDSDSDPDGYPSETGSINSNGEDWREQVHKSKKKHKHKHKKKKKKSSGKDKEKQEKDAPSDEKSSSQDRGGIKHKHKDAMRSERKRRRSRSKSKESRSVRNKDAEAWDTQVIRSRESEKSKPGSSRSQEKNLNSRSRSPKHERNSHKSRSRSRSPKRGYYDEWNAKYYSSKHESDSQSKDRYAYKRKKRSRSKERKPKETREQRLQIDKAKLRRIAIANALVNMKAGNGPQVDVPAVKSGGKSVQELTEFCKKISEKGNTDKGNEVSDSSEEEVARQSDEEEMLIHHPFKIKEPSSTGIVLNIRNSKQLPVQTPLEKQAQKANLRLAFPVSSGSHHRANESEWVPVERPTTSAPTPAQSIPPTCQQQTIAPGAAENKIVEPEPEKPVKNDNIFPDPSEAQKIDIGTIISERLQAVRKLQQNPYDVQALSSIHKAQEQASKWAISKHLPGQFTGSTGARVMSQAELIGDKKHQAWAKKVPHPQNMSFSGHSWSP